MKATLIILAVNIVLPGTHVARNSMMRLVFSCLTICITWLPHIIIAKVRSSPTIIAIAFAAVMLSSSGVSPVLSLTEFIIDVYDSESDIRNPIIIPKANMANGNTNVRIQKDFLVTAVLYSLIMINFSLFISNLEILIGYFLSYFRH